MQMFKKILLVLLGVVTIVFFTSRLTGDPATMIFGTTTSDAQIAAYRTAMGWDQPILLQYGAFLVSLSRFDFGDSFYYRQSAVKVVLERMPATIELAFAALVFAVVSGMVAGIIAAVFRGTVIDTLIMSTAIFWRSMPIFWSALMLIFIFSVQLRWLPSLGRESLLHLILPAFSLGVIQAAQIARLSRSSMIDILGLDFIRTATAKGVARHVVILKHALRNALLPVVTLVGLQLGALLGGAVIAETIFSWPGVGRLVITAILQRDFPVVQVAVLLIAFIFVAINLIIDLLYPFIDPRVKHA
jgi:peptide/nickel transport system permease protein